MKQIFQMTALIPLLFFVSACDRHPPVRYYTEIIRQPAGKQGSSLTGDMRPDMANPNPGMQAMLERSLAAVELIWTVPEGWVEKSGSGLRLATFQSTDDDPITCTLVSLAGDSGGTQANVHRWLRQLNIELSSEDLTLFLQDQKDFRSDGDLPIRLIDVRSLQTGQDGRVPSLIAAIVSLDDKTIFVKMTGSLDAVTTHRQAFEILLQSMKLP